MKIWPKAKLKYVARFAYGDALPPDRESSGEVPVYGSNGPYAVHSISNTAAPALVIGRKGSYGKVNWSSTACFASDTTFYVDETVTQHDLRWIYWLLQTLRLDEGSDEAAVPGLNRESAYEMTVSVPSIPEQRAIADYLDRETGRLDALVAAKERVLELLAEKRRALITRAVTRGLNPNAPLRDSGLPWLGQIPMHWEVVPLRYLVSFISGATPDKGNAEFWNGEIPWVSPKDMKRDIVADSEDHVTEEALEASTLRLLPVSTVLIVVRGMILAHSFPTALTSSRVTINQDMKGLCCREHIEPLFLRDFFKGITPVLVSLMEESAHGTKKMETEVLGNLGICAPPLSEQRAIVAHIERETSKLDTLRLATERTVALLKERRAALIAAAVTGQSDSADSGKLM